MTNRNNNPYIIGTPIREPEKLFGREEFFQFIEDNLKANTKVTLLYGQRRIGKSSVLKQVPHKIYLEEFVFVCFDFQQHNYSSLGDILYELTTEISEQLNLNSDIISLVSEEELNNNPDKFSDVFLPEVYHHLGGKNLLFLLDEFDVVSSNDNNDKTVSDRNSVFSFLHSLLKKQEKLFIIIVLGRYKDDLQKLAYLFKDAPSQEFNLLKKTSAGQLIRKPATGMLDYEDDAIEAIWELSSGHPCLIQYICFNLFRDVKLTVTRKDVEAIVEKTIERATGVLACFWDGLSPGEKVMFSAVADAQKIAIEQKQSFPEDAFTRLKTYGIFETEELIEAAKQLVNKGYLDDTGHRVKIELVRRWLVEYNPLNQKIFKLLEEIKQEEINKISEKAKELYRQCKIEDEIQHYEQILKLNQNHFSTLPLLAESYLEVRNFDKALQLYHRAYQIDYIHNKEGLLHALELYGKYLKEQGEFIKAKVQFEGILKIEPDMESAKEQLVKINAELERQKAPQIQQVEEQLTKPDRNNSINPSSQRVILGIIAGFITILGVSIAVDLYSSIPKPSPTPTPTNTPTPTLTNTLTPTPTNTPTPNDRIQSNISRGDRTLFFSIPNTYRDQGIEAFKQGNYPQAIELFQQAIKADRSDPEVRIYYNNVKAHEKGNPFTLAVVVPAEYGRDRSQEILRGVAQSQEQFNANGGRDGRLLEIVIANDGNNPEQAKKIAQQLVNDKSVLGVIGHGKSQTTEKALDIYKQADIPIISPTSSANTLKGDNFFRTTPSDAAFGEKLAQYAIGSRLNKVVIFYNSKDPYSRSLKEEFRANFKGHINDQIDLKDTTLVDIEQKLKDSASKQVQAVILFPDVEYTDTALDIAKVNVDKKLGLKLLGGDTLYNQKTLQDGGNAFEGLVVAVPWFREARQARDFSQAARKLWGGDISWRTATSYDAAQAFINSLSSQPSRETILQKLTQTNLSTKLTSGNDLKFQKGERQSGAILVKVESGKFTCLNTCSP